jgi:inhibitor of KinA sporulation pathway (predicted exonuclease)
MAINLDSVQYVVDLETLSTRKNAAIVSIGCVEFSLKDGILDEYFVNISPKSAKEHGLHIDKSTVQWWADQTQEARDSWMKDPVDLKTGLMGFEQFYQKACPIWGFGADFDIAILESAFYAIDYHKDKVYGEHLPWRFWDVYCLRTLSNVVKMKLEKTGINHNALHDAHAEAELIMKILKS